MAVIRLLAVASVLLCSIATAATKAVIDGPTDELAGNMIVLNTSATVADVKQWIIPPALEKRHIQTGNQLAFAVRENGVYRFGLVAVSVTGEKTAEINVAVHTVTISGGFAPVEPDPGNPDPDPKPDPDPDPPVASEIRKLSREAAVRLNDPATAETLAKVLKQIPLESMEMMAAKSQAAVEAVLLARKGTSREKDWLGVWRRPINAASKATTPEQLRSVYQAIAAGLEDSLAQAQYPVPDPIPNQPNPSPTVVTIYSRPDCTWCERWKQTVMPTLQSWGWEIREAYSDGSVPRFDVNVPGRATERFVGYQDESRFRIFL